MSYILYRKCNKYCSHFRKQRMSHKYNKLYILYRKSCNVNLHRNRRKHLHRSTDICRSRMLNIRPLLLDNRYRCRKFYNCLRHKSNKRLVDNHRENHNSNLLEIDK